MKTFEAFMSSKSTEKGLATFSTIVIVISFVLSLTTPTEFWVLTDFCSAKSLSVSLKKKVHSYLLMPLQQLCSVHVIHSNLR